eukprot:jgi/Chlat1/5593/Chrsp369S05406
MAGRCDDCEETEAVVVCVACAVRLCADCDNHIHHARSRRRADHTRVPLPSSLDSLSASTTASTSGLDVLEVAADVPHRLWPHWQQETENSTQHCPASEAQAKDTASDEADSEAQAKDTVGETKEHSTGEDRKFQQAKRRHKGRRKVHASVVEPHPQAESTVMVASAKAATAQPADSSNVDEGDATPSEHVKRLASPGPTPGLKSVLKKPNSEPKSPHHVHWAPLPRERHANTVGRKKSHQPRTALGLALSQAYELERAEADGLEPSTAASSSTVQQPADKNLSRSPPVDSGIAHEDVTKHSLQAAIHVKHGQHAQLSSSDGDCSPTAEEAELLSNGNPLSHAHPSAANGSTSKARKTSNSKGDHTQDQSSKSKEARSAKAEKRRLQKLRKQRLSHDRLPGNASMHGIVHQMGAHDGDETSDSCDGASVSAVDGSIESGIGSHSDEDMQTEATALKDPVSMRESSASIKGSQSADGSKARRLLVVEGDGSAAAVPTSSSSDSATGNRTCSGCGMTVERLLECPHCMRMHAEGSSTPPSFFCSQSCFRKNWASHRAKVHPTLAASESGSGGGERLARRTRQSRTNSTSKLVANGDAQPSADTVDALVQAQNALLQAGKMADSGNAERACLQYELAVRLFQKVESTMSARRGTSEQQLLINVCRRGEAAARAGAYTQRRLTGHHDDAASSIVDAMRIYKNLGATAELGQCLFDLAQVQFADGQVQRAQRAFEAAANCLEQAEQWKLTVDALRLSAVASVLTNSPAPAKMLLNRAIQVAVDRGLEAEEARCYRAMADTEEGVKCRSWLEIAVRKFRELHLRQELAEALQQLGDAKVQEHLDSPGGWQVALSGEGEEDLSLVLAAIDDLRESEHLLEDLMDETVSDHEHALAHSLASVCMTMGTAHLLAGRHAEARQYLRRALADEDFQQAQHGRAQQARALLDRLERNNREVRGG